MSALREYFLTESAEYLDRLEALVREDAPDALEMLRLARALRGSAQMAREDRVRRLAATLESAARELQSGDRVWDEDLRTRATRTVADLRHLCRAGEDDSSAEASADEALERWRQVGVQPGGADAAVPGASAGGGPEFDAELRSYVEAEVRGVISELERAVPALTRSPMARDPLKSILRKQRALLGAAGLQRFPVISETLRTIEDVTRLVARQNAAVEGDTLSVYRHAHTVLLQAVQALPRGGTGAEQGAGVEELRGLRDRVLSGAAPEPAAQPPAAPPGGEPVEVLNFFRTESNKLIDRIERMAGAFAAATPDRRRQLGEELRIALDALRDTSRTFGFEGPARAAEQARTTMETGSATSLLEMVDRLREVVGDVGAEASRSDGFATTRAEAVGGPAPGAGPVAGQDAAPAAAPAAAQGAEQGVAPGGRQSDARVPTTAESEVVPIESLLYSGDAALRRALELRERLAAIDDDEARRTVDELFDLIRLAMS